jgi:hypothetical protein
MKPVRFLANLCLMLALCTSLALPDLALAIGPGTGGSKIRVSDEKIGPYILLVATSPLPVTVGQMSVWVRVSDGQTSQLRRDAVVQVEAAPRSGGPTISAQANHKNAGNDYDYVAHLPGIQAAGQWDIKISVQDELGQAEVSFVETVTQGISLNVVVGLAVPFIVLAVVVGIYMWRRSEKGDEER